ncbi:elongation factor P [Coxiella endosymbiont of Amblyomma americanum]|uniref:elongation factor P n=1 Tax=Coxiella endosymbiont of Amblyomma americanum TaxID=325775 RepID=UPI0005807F94|nr:elongation factor P [Coxiella endosymbiont of Amblyomma americanum]AJC50192.1 elongation factor P [Coxiella endosymbiont of Amblyomma americanum]AUJ58553.1 elongation factor P [Coxiella-like endosymbiont of Amblyomma americanum]
METYSANELRVGLKVMINGDPCSIIENEFVKPGKGQAFNRVRFRNLKTDRILERTLKSGEVLLSANVIEIEMQYLYDDGEIWYFMIPETYEQYAVPSVLVGERKQWIKEATICTITMWNGVPLSIALPTFVELKIIETDPGIRGDTVVGGTKRAKLESGAIIRVPLFLNKDDIIKVDTRHGIYVSRVK